MCGLVLWVQFISCDQFCVLIHYFPHFFLSTVPFKIRRNHTLDILKSIPSGSLAILTKPMCLIANYLVSIWCLICHVLNKCFFLLFIFLIYLVFSFGISYFYLLFSQWTSLFVGLLTIHLWCIFIYSVMKHSLDYSKSVSSVDQYGCHDNGCHYHGFYYGNGYVRF